MALASVAAAAHAATPALGRWSGASASGKAQFVVSRVGRTLVASDLVLSCANGAGIDADAHGQDVTTKGLRVPHPESAVAANGVISDGVDVTSVLHDSTGLHGRLSGASGTVSPTMDDMQWLGTGTCPASAFHDIHVSRTGGTELRDGHYTVTGLPLTSGDFWVYGDGALIDYDANFSTPTGGGEDNPEQCREDGLYADVGSASVPYTPILPSPSGSFALQATQTDDVGTRSTIALAGAFHGTHAVGIYSARSDWLANFACTGTGAFALTPRLLAVPLIADAVRRGVATLPGRHRGAPTHKPNPAPGRHRPDKRITYVALGDSYAAGVGLPPYLPGAGGIAFSCLRSTRAYSRQLQIPGVELERKFYACSGATTANLLKKGGKRGEPPQLKHASLRKAKLVSVQFGGDDAGFLPVLIRCARLTAPLACTGPGARRILSRVSKLEPTLVRSFRVTRHATARGTMIAALDYPLLFPQSRGDYCRKLLTWYSPAAVALINRAGNLLDDEIKTAAHTVGIRFADVRHAFAGHEVCARHEWINFVTKGIGFGFGNGTLHPNWAGQRAYARMLRRAVANAL